MILAAQSYVVQSLLLFVDYEQNHQRSISSCKTLVKAVGIAYELGLHATETNSDVGSAQIILHKSIWQTLVYYDR
jgi:7-cyano-7-deazaguanine synthase in queuosine biosynthesis